MGEATPYTLLVVSFHGEPLFCLEGGAHCPLDLLSDSFHPLTIPPSPPFVVSLLTTLTTNGLFASSLGYFSLPPPPPLLLSSVTFASSPLPFISLIWALDFLL